MIRQQSFRPFSQDFPLGLAADFPGKADPAAIGFQHHIPARQGDFPGHRRSFIASCIFDYLDQEHLPFPQLFSFFQGQETVLAGSHIYKGSLDPRHHIADPAPVHIAHQIVRTAPFHRIVSELIILHGSHAGFFRPYTYIDRIHGRTSQAFPIRGIFRPSRSRL